MSVRRVTKIGDPILRLVARDLTPREIDSPELGRLVEDMIDTMRAEDGIGIAAPQLGEPVQLAVVELQESSSRYPGLGSLDATVFINPRVSVLDEAEQAFWEGCLSVPDLRGLVHRPRRVRVGYLDLDGRQQSLEAEGFLATVLQHELDHLQGVLFVDRVRDTRLLATTGEYRRHWMDRPVEEPDT
jgi:peptide deformylase